LAAYKVLVKQNSLKRDMYYKDHLILTYTINYPQFISDQFKGFLKKLNIYYKTDARLFEKFHVMKLYQMAIDDYEYAVANNFPVRKYEVLVEYTVTYNQNCAISLYIDRYEYTGGAHGITHRDSNNWDIKKGKKINLEDIFPKIKNYREYVINEINKQIENNMQTENNMYFEDYTSLVRENFQIQNFYLVPEGVVVYFQLYEIAPYVSGIPTFILPFSEAGAKQPACIR
jgi:hypothetical protein